APSVHALALAHDAQVACRTRAAASDQPAAAVAGLAALEPLLGAGLRLTALRTHAAVDQSAAAVGCVVASLLGGASRGRHAGYRRRHARAQIEDHELEQLLLRVHRIEAIAARAAARALRIGRARRAPRAGVSRGVANARAVRVGSASSVGVGRRSSDVLAALFWESLAFL